MNKWPKHEDIENVMKDLDDASSWSHGSGMPTSSVDRIKYNISSEFIIYKRENNLTLRELAQMFEVSEDFVSKILRHQTDEVTIDCLLLYLEKMGIKYEFKKITE